jgi:hypothetical protein
MITVHTPVTENEKNLAVSIFLAGSIDNGTAEEWQKTLIKRLNKTSDLIGVDYEVYNPRRDYWDKDCAGDELVRQIEWELNRLEMCDIIFLCFAPDSLSPISLLELGLHKSDNIVVYCPKEFYRYTNVEVTCDFYNVLFFDDLNDAYEALIENSITVNKIKNIEKSC